MTEMAHVKMNRRKAGRILLSLLAAVVILPLSGCLATYGPQLGILGVPIPVSPYLQRPLRTLREACRWAAAPS